MPGIGVDMKEILNEVGLVATILRTPTNLTEKITYDVNAASSNAFLREHFLNGTFAYDTIIKTGDLILVHNIPFLVVNMTSDDFEGEVVEYASVIYKCNLPNGTRLLTPTEAIDPVTFVMTNGWTVKKDGVIGLIYQDKRSTIPNSDVFAGRDLTFSLELTIPVSYNAAINDRLYLNANEYYRVQYIEHHRFPDIDILALTFDERPVYTP